MKKQLEVLYVSSKKVQKAISKPIPKKIIDCFYSTPLTASEIAEAVSFPKDKIYYHIFYSYSTVINKRAGFFNINFSCRYSYF